ncbi:MAG: FG-GAP-like repeat-containing protein, partial [Planctomycetota bacterium]
MLAVLLALAPQAAPTQLVVPRVSTFPIAARRTAGRDADQLLLAGGLFTPGQLTAFEVDPTSGMLQGTALLEADSFGGVLGVLDVDGDGRDDLVQQDRILFDETPFGFAAPSTVAVDLPLVPSGLRAVARSVDLDANGRDDIVLFHPDGLAPVQAIYALGHRSFSAAVPLPDVGDPRAAELFDADADGDLDLVTLTAAGAFEIRENDGGPFPWPVTWSEDLGFRGDPIVLIADDLDGDGSNDLLVGRRELRVHLGGSNGFATSAVIPGALVRSRAW